MILKHGPHPRETQLLTVANAQHADIATRVRKASIRHNERRCDVFSLLAVEDVQRSILARLSVRELWHCRGVSKEFAAFAYEQLGQLPRLMAVGGFAGVTGNLVTSSSCVLNFATMRWHATASMAERRFGHAACVLADGRLVRMPHTVPVSGG